MPCLNEKLHLIFLFMPPTPPILALSRGQLAWALARGEAPSDLLLSQLRYLRQIGIPFADGERGAGRGHRITYDFHDLMETGVAYEALRLGVQPRLLQMLIDERSKYHAFFDFAYGEIKEAAWSSSWIRSKGREHPGMLHQELLIRTQDRFDQEPGNITIIGFDPDAPTYNLPFGTLVEEMPDQLPRVVIPVKRLILELVTFATEAPATRPGPKS